MRIEQLEYVATVARLGSFRRAADELHISQPALSGSVRSLERELGVDLLDRGRHGARMSDSGRELFPYILTLLDSFDRLRHAAGEQHRSVRLVRLGTVSAATAPLLAPTIQQFRQSHPLTQVEVIGAQQTEIHRGVLEGSFDLGLVNYLDGDDMPPALETTPLLRGHVEGRDVHERSDREPQQPVLAESHGVQAAHQHHRQQELHRVVEGFRRAQGKRAPLQAVQRDRLARGAQARSSWKILA